MTLINGYSSSAGTDSEDVPKGSILTNLAVGNGTSSVKYGVLDPDPTAGRRLEQLAGSEREKSGRWTRGRSPLDETHEGGALRREDVPEHLAVAGERADWSVRRNPFG